MRTAQEKLPAWGQLRNSGLAVLGVGIVGTVLLGLLHGGLHWSNTGLLLIVASVVMLLQSAHKRRAASREDASSRSP